jgi:hypothetical protein
MSDAEKQQDQAMGDQDEEHQPVREMTPAAFYHRLQVSVSKALDIFNADEAQQQGTAEIIDDLVTLLQEKDKFCYLTKEESLFYSALLQVQWSLNTDEGQSSFSSVEDVIKAHLDLTFNSNASSANLTAYLSYVSLLLSIYYSYVDVEPVENELTLVDSSGGQARDIVGEWIGLQKRGPLIFSSGRYQQKSVALSFARTKVAHLSDEVVAQLDTARSATSIREQLREAYSRIAGDIAEVSRSCVSSLEKGRSI